jgi:predicted nucleic acid-binding protein
VDTTFLVARFNTRDRNHRAARAFLEAQGQPGASPYRLVLTDYIFDETVTTILYRSGRHDVAARAGRAIRDSKVLRLLKLEEPVIDAAWNLFLERPDKLWSFTDCTSFVLMENLDMRKALTFDHNFPEAGFVALP